MATQRPSGLDNQADLNTLLARAKRHVEGADRVGRVEPARQATLRPLKDINASARMLLGGLIALQILALLVALVVVAPIEPATRPQEAARPFNTPAAVETPSPRPEQPATDTPQATPPPVAPALPAAAPVEPVTAPIEPVGKPTEPPLSVEGGRLRLRGVEITQGIQVFNEPENPLCQPDPNQANYIFCNNSIPLVAGRHTLVRVYPACNGDCPTTEISLRLHLLKDGQEQANLTRQWSAEMLQRVNRLPLQELRLRLDNSVNFEFLPPPAWMSGQITFEFEASAGQELPASLTLSRNFITHKPLRIAYLPIQYQGLRAPEPAGVDYWLQRLYPVAEVKYYRLPVPDLVWEGELNKSEILRQLLYTYWLYIQNQPQEAWPDQLFGWLPQEFYNGGVSDPFWCPNCAGLHSSRVAFGGLRPEQDIGGPRILVHEIAHNLGAQHAWSPTYQEDASCFKAEGVDIRVDPTWPYPQTPHIQEFGIDLYSQPPIIYPPTFYDMMAYCARPWISPHTYRKLFDSPFLQPQAPLTLPLANIKPQPKIGADGTLLVSGVIYPDGTVSRPEVIYLEGTAFANSPDAFTPPLQFAPPSGGDYCLEVQANDSRTLARRCFEAGFIDLETGQRTEDSPFFFSLPDIAASDVAKISLSKNEVTLVSVTPSNSPPEVTLTFPDGGERVAGRQTVTWTADDADGDSLLYDLLYSPDDGQSWLPLAVRLNRTDYTFYTSQVPASEQALIRVIATDGFHTGLDESDSPFAIEPPLENSFSLLGPATVEAGQTFDVAVVANQVTEPGLFGVQFKLHFDPTLVQVDQVRLHPDLNLVVDKTIQNQAGWVSIVASRQGQVSNLSGDLTLATFTFTAISPANDVQLHLSDLVAGARGGLPLVIPQIEALALRIVE